MTDCNESKKKIMKNESRKLDLNRPRRRHAYKYTIYNV